MQHKVTAAFGVFALTMLAACGGGDQANEQGAPSAEAPAAAPAPAEGGMGTAMLPEGVTQAMVTEGDNIFHTAGQCFACHGPDAKGTALAPDLTDDQWLNTTGHNFDEIVAVVMDGVATPKEHPAAMPAKGGANITDAQVRSVAAYVYSLSGH